MLDLEPIRENAERCDLNPWTEDVFALLAEVERLRAERLAVRAVIDAARRSPLARALRDVMATSA